jgi:hypothetical protein
MVRAGLPQKVPDQRALDGVRVDRYDIVDEADLAAALDRTGTYLERRREDPQKVVPLPHAV